MEKIRILVVDDHPIIREGLEFFLNQDPDLLVLGCAQRGRSGLELLRKLNPDVVVLDLGMPQLDGFEAIRLFLDFNPRLDIVVFSAHSEEKMVFRALRAGARGYVVKGSSMEELKQAIRYVREGGAWVSPQFSRQIVEGFISGGRPLDNLTGPLELLSERELQVLRFLATGRETEEVSALLDISVSTVAKHRISLMKKLGVKNAVELARLAIREGFVEV